MATQTIDGSWTETKPLPEALLDFQLALTKGAAKRFVVGTKQDVAEEKAAIAVKDELAAVKDRLAMLEARSDQSMVAVPTLAEVREYGRR